MRERAALSHAMADAGGTPALLEVSDLSEGLNMRIMDLTGPEAGSHPREIEQPARTGAETNHSL